MADLSLGQKLLRYFRDPTVATWRKLAGFMAVLYVVSPIDAIPDFFPIAGWLDDLGVLGMAATFMVREITRYASSHDTRQGDVIDGEVVEKRKRD